MEYLGLLFEILFLGLGIFAYRIATKKIKVSESQRPFMEQFVKENGGWLKILSIALMAIMTVEIGLHIMQILNKL